MFTIRKATIEIKQIGMIGVLERHKNYQKSIHEIRLTLRRDVKHKFDRIQMCVSLRIGESLVLLLRREVRTVRVAHSLQFIYPFCSFLIRIIF